MSDPERIHIWSERGDETESKFGFISFDPRTGDITGDFQTILLQPTAGSVVYDSLSLTRNREWLLFAFTEEEGEIYIADIQ